MTLDVSLRFPHQVVPIWYQVRLLFRQLTILLFQPIRKGIQYVTIQLTQWTLPPLVEQEHSTINGKRVMTTLPLIQFLAPPVVPILPHN